MNPEVQLDILQRLSRIEAKVDGLSKHESRLSSLERWRSWATGFAACVVLGGGIALKFWP